MKNILIIIAITTNFLFNSAKAGGFETTMTYTIEKLYAAQELETFDAVANQFVRIGDAEKDKWEPYYYASLSYVFKAFKISELPKQDLVLDMAHIELAKAAKLDPNNVEIVALTGFINMIKIGVDPGTRGQTLSPKVYADFGRALQIDANNPRANLFMAQMQHGTAQFFGKGIEEACTMVDKSVLLFEQFVPSSPLTPVWGKESAIDYQKLCAQTPSK